MDEITHTRTDKGHFYSPPSPTSGDKNMKVHPYTGKYREMIFTVYSNLVQNMLARYNYTYVIPQVVRSTVSKNR